MAANATNSKTNSAKPFLLITKASLFVLSLLTLVAFYGFMPRAPNIAARNPATGRDEPRAPKGEAPVSRTAGSQRADFSIASNLP
jgi:hypothetical protein